MPDFEFAPELPARQAVLYTPNVLNRTEKQQFEGLYAESGIAQWAAARVSKFAEIVEPTALYVSADQAHTVAWVRHSGLVEGRAESPKGYHVHHVVCDCAAEVGDTAAHPDEVLGCDYVQEVLNQRAVEIGKKQAAGDMLSRLYRFDETTQDLRLCQIGQELVLLTIAYVLETDKNHPEQWMANRISGLHDIERLAVIVQQDTSAVMPILEQMEEVGLVEVRGDKVKLDPHVR